MKEDMVSRNQRRELCRKRRVERDSVPLLAVGARALEYSDVILCPPSRFCEGSPLPRAEAGEYIGEPH